MTDRPAATRVEKARRSQRLGALERAVLEALWSRGPSDVRTMHDAVGRRRGITLHTVQSTLERLWRKGLARREKQGRAFVYAAALSREAWASRAIEALLREESRTGRGTLIAAFVDAVARAEPRDLAELETLIRARRARDGREEE